MYGPDGAPLVALSVRHQPPRQFLVLPGCTNWPMCCCISNDAAGEGSPIYVDDMSLGQPGDGNGEAQREREADAMAGDALLPLELWQTFDTGRATALRIVARAREAEVHPSIVAGKVRRELGNYRRFAELVGNGMVRPFFPGGRRLYGLEARRRIRLARHAAAPMAAVRTGFMLGVRIRNREPLCPCRPSRPRGRSAASPSSTSRACWRGRIAR